MFIFGSKSYGSAPRTVYRDEDSGMPRAALPPGTPSAQSTATQPKPSASASADPYAGLEAQVSKLAPQYRNEFVWPNGAVGPSPSSPVPTPQQGAQDLANRVSALPESYQNTFVWPSNYVNGKYIAPPPTGTAPQDYVTDADKQVAASAPRAPAPVAASPTMPTPYDMQRVMPTAIPGLPGTYTTKLTGAFGPFAGI